MERMVANNAIVLSCHSHLITCDGCACQVGVGSRFTQIWAKGHTMNFCHSCCDKWLNILKDHENGAIPTMEDY